MKFFTFALSTFIALVLSVNVVAQQVPGTEVSDSVIVADAKIWVSLVESEQPDIFSGASAWHSFDSYYIKYFSTSGVFVGVLGDDMYLLGGPFGDNLTYMGTTSEALEAMDLSLDEATQNLPGTPISNAAVSQNAKTLVSLAMQLDAATFSSPSTWRAFSGYQYKLFAGSGVIIGIKDEQLYLLGGQFGDALTNQGMVSDVLAALQDNGGSSSSFSDIVTTNTLLDLINYFTHVKVDMRTTTSAIDLQSSVTIDWQGKENVVGVEADKLIVTLDGSNVSEPVLYTMWVNSSGTVVKLLHNSTMITYSSPDIIGKSLVSSALLTLRLADQPIVQDAIANQLADIEGLQQNTENQVINGIQVKVLTIGLEPSPSATYQFQVTDFGSISIATQYSASLTNVLGTTTSSFELNDIALR